MMPCGHCRVSATNVLCAMVQDWETFEGALQQPCEMPFLAFGSAINSVFKSAQPQRGVSHLGDGRNLAGHIGVYHVKNNCISVIIGITAVQLHHHSEHVQ